MKFFIREKSQEWGKKRRSSDFEIRLENASVMMIGERMIVHGMWSAMEWTEEVEEC